MGKSDRPFNEAFHVLASLRPKTRSRGASAAQRATEAVLHQSTAAGAGPLPAAEPLSPEQLFSEAVRDAQPLPQQSSVTPGRPVQAPAPMDPDAEVVAELDRLVTGEIPFDIGSTDEAVEGLADGVDRRLLRRLRRGEYATAAHLDLHGKTRKEARPLIESFVRTCRQEGKRCVLIVHGRGLHSKDKIPVLKEALTLWLTRGRISRAVLAFCTARPCDGGWGAVYVLLRK